MSPELETLDQLQGGDLPPSVVRKLYPDNVRFLDGVLGLLRSGDVRLTDKNGRDVPEWRWGEALAEAGARLSLTDQGAKRIG